MVERGMINVVLSNLREVSKARVIPALARAAIGDFSGVMKLLVEVELLMCKGLPVRGVFMLNIMFDMLMGVNSLKLLEKFHRFVDESLGVTPGFFTMNHPHAVKVLCDEIGLKEPWLCSNFNIGGFRANPTMEAVIQSFACGKSKNIAMSIFASGALDGEHSLDFVLNAKGVDSLVFGSASRVNIEKNVRSILTGKLVKPGIIP